MKPLRILLMAGALMATGISANAATANKVTIECNTKCDTCLCVTIPGHGIDLVFFRGPASITQSGAYTMPGPDFVTGFESTPALFAHTDAGDPNVGTGWVDVRGFYLPDGSEAIVYEENQPTYSTYVAWNAARQ